MFCYDIIISDFLVDYLQYLIQATFMFQCNTNIRDFLVNYLQYLFQATFMFPRNVIIRDLFWYLISIYDYTISST